MLHNCVEYAAINYMSAIMSQNGRKMAKMLHNAAKKCEWAAIIMPPEQSSYSHPLRVTSDYEYITIGNRR